MNTVLYFQSYIKTSAQKKLDGVREVAGKLGWHVQLVEIRPTRATVRELAKFWHPVGAIAECSGWNARELDLSAFSDLPTVYLDAPSGRLPPDAFSVSQDSRLCGRTAARALLETGRSDFAYVSYLVPRIWSDERRDGFRDALKINGRDCRVLESPRRSTGPLDFQRRLSRFLQELPRPSAIFAANDTTAEAVLTEIQRLGLKTPNDFAVLGVDNFEPLCNRIQLSSIEPDFRRGGGTAALMLSALIRDGKAYCGSRTRSYGPLRTVIRHSTRCASNAVGADVAAALELIHREACNGLTAEKVLASFDCSRTLAARKFHRAMGHTVLKEIHTVQLARALEMLRDPQQLITPIADFCGLGNPNSLKKLFHREFGLSMREWRRQNLRDGLFTR